jgi:RsiW-degrading membrane proteinase PrsW (M82 family)
LGNKPNGYNIALFVVQDVISQLAVAVPRFHQQAKGSRSSDVLVTIYDKVRLRVIWTKLWYFILQSAYKPPTVCRLLFVMLFLTGLASAGEFLAWILHPVEK